MAIPPSLIYNPSLLTANPVDPLNFNAIDSALVPSYVKVVIPLPCVKLDNPTLDAGIFVNPLPLPENEGAVIVPTPAPPFKVKPEPVIKTEPVKV